jgi:hypothetical protein
MTSAKLRRLYIRGDRSYDTGMIRACATIVLILAATAACAQTATAPANAAPAAEPTFEQEMIVERTRLEKEASELPVIHVASLRDVIAFEQKNDLLVGRSPLPDEPSPARLNVPGLPGLLRFMRLGMPRPADQGPRDFQIIHDDLTRPAEGHVSTMISFAAGRLLIARDRESATDHSSIQFIQDGSAIDGPREDLVRLYITFNIGENEKAIDTRVSAADFPQLRRRYAREVDEFLRPIVRDFGAEGTMFAVTPEVAWQVLGGDYAPDSAMKKRVNELVQQFNADDFRVRQSAIDELKKLGQSAVLALMKLDRAPLSPQQSSTIDSFLSTTAPLSDQDANVLREDVSFLLDVAFTPDALLRDLALRQLGKTTRQPIALDPNLDEAGRASEIAKLRAKLIPRSATDAIPSQR